MILAFVVAGLVSGSVYGMAGVGLVLTYKTSGIFNFAYGGVATIAAYSFYALHVEHRVPWPVAAAIVLVIIAPAVGLVLERVAVALRPHSLAVRVASTVGLLLVIQSSYQIVYGTTVTRDVPPFLGTHTYRILGVNVSTEQIITFVISCALTGGLQAFFRWRRLGLAMRAVVNESDLLDLAGTNPAAVRRRSWILGTMFASTAGLLLASSVQLTGSTLTLLVVQAFGAAAIGSFASLPVTFAGGLVIGVLGSVASKYFTHGILAGLPATLPFVVLFLVLLVLPKSRLAAGAVIRPRARSAWGTPPRLQVAAGVVTLALLISVPHFAGIHLADWTTALCDVLVFLSLGLLVRTSGQVSLGHVAFVAIGAATYSHLASDHHWPWALALVTSGLVAVPVGAVLAIPAIRLGGLYLALATLGFTILVADMFYTSSFMFGEQAGGLLAPRPDVGVLDFTEDNNFYYLVLAIVVVITLALVGLQHSRLGRLLRALADAPTALATSGVAVTVTQVIVFCLSAFLAALAGALGGMNIGVVTGDSYQPLMSLTLLTFVIVTVGGTPWFALQAALALDVVPSYLTGDANVVAYLQIAFGVAAVAYAFVQDRAREVPAPLRRFLGPAKRVQTPFADAGPADDRTTPPANSLTLELDGVTVRYGGLVAVDGVSLTASTGKIVGLIGPNGAGKTTTFNACSGLARVSAGDIRVNDVAYTRRSIAARARAGIGRTFQQVQLFDSLSVRDNVALGAEGCMAGASPLRHFVASRREVRQIAEASDAALDLCGITHLAGTPTGSLSTGQRRLVELARCLAGPFDLLLLDEPSSGLDKTETAQFGQILRHVVTRRGVGVLIVEHDMELVTTICDWMYVLDYGKLIFSGDREALEASPVVRAAYLGDLSAGQVATS